MKTLDQGPEGATTLGQPPARIPSMAAANPFVRLLLRSPLHALLSGSLLLLTYTGRTSGRQYTIPVTYVREGDVVTVLTQHQWWKNVYSGAPVSVEIKRQRFAAHADAFSDAQPEIAAALAAHLCAHPSMARVYHIPMDAAGQYDQAALQQAARFLVLMRIRLAPAVVG
jgi:deazaflavin-dependent oxidoreductase (nitroreductase family)